MLGLNLAKESEAVLEFAAANLVEGVAKFGFFCSRELSRCGVGGKDGYGRPIWDFVTNVDASVDHSSG